MSAEPTQRPAEEAPGRRRIWLRLVLSLLIGAALAWMLFRGGLPVLPTDRSVAADWVWFVYPLSLVAVHFFRASRWRHLLRPLGPAPLGQTLAIAWVGFAAVLFLPLRSGELVRPYLMGRRGGVRGWEAAGTVGAERILDGLILSLLLLGALQLTTPLDPLPSRLGNLPLPVAAVPAGAYLASLVFAAGFVALALFYWRRQWGVRLVRGLLGWVSPRLADTVAGVVSRVADGLKFLPSAAALLPFLLETALYWGLNAAGLWWLAHGCGLTQVEMLEACVVMGVLGIGVLAPSAPGYFGTYQLAMYMGLAMFVSADTIPTQGAMFVFVAYVTQLSVHALGGLFGWLWLRRQVTPAAASA